MLGLHDEIASSYRRTCTDLKEKLRIGLYKIYSSYKNGWQGNPSNPEDCMENIFDSMVIFERKLLHYVRIKQEFQTENKNLQMKLKELQLNLQAKNVCISKLKEDIVSHYVQIEFLRKNNEKLEGDLGSTRKKLIQFEKSEEWLEQKLFPVPSDTKYKRKLISDEIFQQRDKTETKSYEEKIQIQINHESNNNNELRKFHVKLIEVCHENIFLKQALHKMKIITEREDKLKRLLKSNNDKSTILKLEDVENESHSESDISKENGRHKREQITNLNKIIDCLKVTVLQLQFERRNMELSVFRIREYFLKMKDMQRKLKLLVGNKQSSMSSVLKKSRIHGKKFPDEDEGCVQELMVSVGNLKLEKLQMEIEHQDELRSFTDKFDRMQYILRDIENVFDNISEPERMAEIQKFDYHQESKNHSTSEILLEDNSSCKENSTISPTVSYNYYANLVQTHKNNLLDIHKRVKLVEEKYKRIILVCSKNMELLKVVDNRSLIPLIRQLKVLVLVKDKRMIEEQGRFEKHKRFLLNSLRDNRKSHNVTKKQCEALKNYLVCVTLELKHMKIEFSKIQKRMQNSEEKDDFTKAIQRINNLTEKIQMHAELDEPIRYSDTSNISNNSCENLDAASEENGSQRLLEHGKQKILPICILSEQLIKCEDTLDETNQHIFSLREDLNISKTLIEQLKQEKANLQAALIQRDHLLGRIFNSFKRQINGVADEINEKYFLQRLCNDLKSAIKVYGDQNTILKEALENNNICPRTIYIQRTLRRNSANITEDSIRRILKQHGDSCQMQETFSEIQSHLESMKSKMSLLQNVAIKR